MSNEDVAFDDFVLSATERRLTRGGEPLDVSGRYLDALLLLARSPGELVTKDRFMAEVWRGVPVTDEALTQCIRSLRKALGDQAARPRYIETVPRHGYRFLADVRMVERAGSGIAPIPVPEATQDIQTASASAPGDPTNAVDSATGFKRHSARSQFLLLTAAGLVGGAGAGLAGGLGYGMLAATEPPAGTGAISILLVMICVCVLVAMVGGLGVAIGAGLGRLVRPGRLFPVMAGGAVGGLAVGAAGRLIGLDAFALLIGSRPLAITGGSEGLLIGALAGAGLWLAERDPDAAPATLFGKGALLGVVAGLLVTLGGGQMMAGSLAGLVSAHPEAPLARVLGDPSPLLLLAAGAAEGAIFIAALTLAFTLVLRSRSSA